MPGLMSLPPGLLAMFGPPQAVKHHILGASDLLKERIWIPDFLASARNSNVTD
jgi:hypothetical protein